jgi:hypothetical protein
MDGWIQNFLKDSNKFFLKNTVCRLHYCQLSGQWFFFIFVCYIFLVLYNIFVFVYYNFLVMIIFHLFLCNLFPFHSESMP